MNNYCAFCGRLIREGQSIEVKVTSVYHELKSKIHWAIDRNNFDCVEGSLRHINCDEA